MMRIEQMPNDQSNGMGLSFRISGIGAADWYLDGPKGLNARPMDILLAIVKIATAQSPDRAETVESARDRLVKAEALAQEVASWKDLETVPLGRLVKAILRADALLERKP